MGSLRRDSSRFDGGHGHNCYMLDFDKAGPHDPDGSTAAVYMLYGAAMHRVQGLEHGLAFLSMVVTHDPYAKPEGTMRDQFPATFKRWWRAFQKDTAGRALSKIEGQIPADLYIELQAFIKRRNWFAHRFFIEQMDVGEDGNARFARGTVVKLFEVASDSGQLTKRVFDYNDAVRASWTKPSEQPPAEFMQWTEDFAHLVMRRKVRADVWADIQARRQP